MANKKVKYSDIAENNLFQEGIDSAKAFLKILEEIEKQFKATIKVSSEASKNNPIKSYDDAKKAEKDINDVQKAVKGLAEIEKQRGSLVKKIINAESNRLNNLKELDINLSKLKKQLSQVNQAEKKGQINLKTAAKLRSDLNLKIKSTSQAIKAEQKAALDSLKTTVKLNTTQKEKIKLEEKLKGLQSEQTKSNALLREEINRQNKELRDNAKAALDAENAYKKLTKETNEAQAEFKRLAAQFGVNSEQAQKAFKTFEKLDNQLREVNNAAKDGRRDVGRYKDALQEIEEELKDSRKRYLELALAGQKNSKEAKNLIKQINVLDKRLKRANKTLKENSENTNEAVKQLRRFRKSAAKFRVTLGLLSFGLGGVLGFLSAIGGAFNQSREGTVGLRSVLINLTSVVQVFVSSLGEAATPLKAFGNALLNLDFDEARKQLNIALSSLDNFGERVNKVREEQLKLLKVTTQYEIGIQKLERSLVGLREEQEKSRNTANDDTLSFVARTKAFNDNVKVNEQVAAKEKEIAEKRLELTQRQVIADLKAAKIFVSTRQEVINALSNQDTAIKVSKENADAFNAAFVALGEAQINAANVAFENAQQRRKLISDIEERNLDILIDAFDTQKTINERIIADETQTFDKRRNLLNETIQLGEESFKKQIETVKSFSKQTIDLNSDLNDSEKERLKQRIDSADIESLLSVQNSVELNKRIRELGLSEIFEGRQLEIIRDRITAIKDLKDANRDLTASEREGREIQSDLTIQDKLIEKLANIQDLKKEGLELEEILSEFEKERLQNDINNLTTRLALAKEGSKEFLDIQKELNEKLIEQQQQRLNKEKELDKKALEKRVELTKAATNGINQLFEKQSQQQLNNIDRQIEASKKREEELRELAQDNVQEATESLATEQRKQAELERDRERAIKRRQRLEFALSAIQTYSNKVAAGEENALGSTITDLSVLRAFVDSLPTFFTGSEMVGNDLQESSLLKGESNDKHLIRVDGSERILTGEQNKLIGNMSNLELATLAHAHNTGNLVNNVNVIDLSSVNKQLKEVKNAIENKPVLRDINYDAINHAISETVERKGRREKNIKRVKNIF